MRRMPMTEATCGGVATPDLYWRTNAALENVARGGSDVPEVPASRTAGTGEVRLMAVIGSMLCSAFEARSNIRQVVRRLNQSFWHPERRVEMAGDRSVKPRSHGFDVPRR